MNRLTKRLAVASSLAVLAALTMGSSTASAQQIPGCIPATNIEGIIDDSGSMLGNDGDNYRADLLEALAFFNRDKTMGAVIFADSAAPLFGPFLAGPNFTAIKSALAGVSSSGVVGFGTSYNAGFSAGNAQNPNANARIFLSDGQPTDGSSLDPNLWRTPNIRSYVVGFGSADFTVLNQIATETGGPSPFAVTTASQLRNVSQIINARLNCQPDPILIERPFVRTGQTKGVAFNAEGNTAQVLISWPTVGNLFKALFGKGKKGKKSLASLAKKKKGRVRVQSTRGESFLALNLSGLKGKVKFKLNAKRLLVDETVTIAVIP
jgi:von Willebrand factor type A domain